MKFIYIDESGKDDKDPFAVLCGVSFDVLRMRKTKLKWLEFIAWLNKKGIKTSELHAAEFFAGKGPWYKMKAVERKLIANAIVKWLKERAHEFCVVSVEKKLFDEHNNTHQHPFKNYWSFLATHLIFTFSKKYQTEKGTKGDFVAIFDQGCVGKEFNEFINSKNANELFTEYYGKNQKVIKLADTPMSADSKQSSLVQVADFVAFFCRRKIELESEMKERYVNEKKDIDDIFDGLSKIRIDNRFVYKKVGRSEIESVFFDLAPPYIKK